MNARTAVRLALKTIVVIALASAQTTKTIKKTEVLTNPANPKSTVGSLNADVEITKLGKDKSGKYVRATMEVYIPVEALKEGRIARRVGESQAAEQTLVTLVNAQRDGNNVHLALEVTNRGTKNMDMSALLLVKLLGDGKHAGNLEFMKSQNSVGIIPPGKTLRSDLVYTFAQPISTAELSFQPRMGGDQIFFLMEL